MYIATRFGIRRTASGFTLVETVIVVLIISILLAVATPQMIDSLSYQRVKAAANQAASHLRLVRRDAMARGAASGITFSTARQRYQLDQLTNPDHPSAVWRVSLGQMPVMATLVAADFGTRQQVTFNGFGLPDAAGSVTFAVGPYLQSVSVAADGTVTVDAAPRRGP